MNNELLQAISDMMDKKLEPITATVGSLTTTVDSLTVNMDSLTATVDSLTVAVDALTTEIHVIHERLDRIEHRLDVLEFKQERTDKKLDDLQLNMKIFERDVKKELHTLRDEMDTVIELLKIHKIMPV